MATRLPRDEYDPMVRRAMEEARARRIEVSPNAMTAIVRAALSGPMAPREPLDWSLVATPASLLAAEDGGGADNSRAGYVTVPKYLLLDLLDNNLEAANLSLMPVSGIDMIEARGGPDAEEPEDRMAYYLYYATVAAAQLRDVIAAPPSQAGVREVKS